MTHFNYTLTILATLSLSLMTSLACNSISKDPNTFSDGLDATMQRNSGNSLSANSSQLKLTHGTLEQFISTSPVFRYFDGTPLEQVEKDYPDLNYSTVKAAHISRSSKSEIVEVLEFYVYKEKINQIVVYFKENAISGERISQTLTQAGYQITNERDVSVTASHKNGAFIEAKTARGVSNWKFSISPGTYTAPPKEIKTTSSAPKESLGSINANSNFEVIKKHLANFLTTAPLFQFTEATPISQVKQFYSEVVLMEGTTSDYTAKDKSLDFVEHVEFKTENDGKRLKHIQVFFMPGLNKDYMSKAFSEVLKEKYGDLVKDEATEHLVRRKDFTNAFHTRWYFPKKQWGAGIYPPRD